MGHKTPTLPPLRFWASPFILHPTSPETPFDPREAKVGQTALTFPGESFTTTQTLCNLRSCLSSTHITSRIQSCYLAQHASATSTRPRARVPAKSRGSEGILILTEKTLVTRTAPRLLARYAFVLEPISVSMVPFTQLPSSPRTTPDPDL